MGAHHTNPSKDFDVVPILVAVTARKPHGRFVHIIWRRSCRIKPRKLDDVLETLCVIVPQTIVPPARAVFFSDDLGVHVTGMIHAGTLSLFAPMRTHVRPASLGRAVAGIALEERADGETEWIRRLRYGDVLQQLTYIVGEERAALGVLRFREGVECTVVLEGFELCSCDRYFVRQFHDGATLCEV